MRAVIALSDALGMTTVAEGVEVPLQQHFLAAQGCPLAQGRLFGDALPAAEMTAQADRRAGLIDESTSAALTSALKRPAGTPMLHK